MAASKRRWFLPPQIVSAPARTLLTSLRGCAASSQIACGQKLREGETLGGVCSDHGTGGALLGALSLCGNLDADAPRLASRVLELVVSRAESRGYFASAVALSPGGVAARAEDDEVVEVVRALAQLLPSQAAAEQLLQLATLDRDPWRCDVQAALRTAIPDLVATLDGTIAASDVQNQVALALSFMALNSRRSKTAVVEAVDVALRSSEERAIETSVHYGAIAVLSEGGICSSGCVSRLLARQAASAPGDLVLQQRISGTLLRLVEAGRIEEQVASRSGASALLDRAWSPLLGRFLGAEAEGKCLECRFHRDVQALFNEQVVKHFEYEAAERSLQLLQRGVSGPRRLREILRCYVESLDDYGIRLRARNFAWDESAGQLLPLNDELRARFVEEMARKMEAGLMLALRAAAACTARTPLRRRRTRLRSECAALLELKTEATEEHQERAAGLRREVVLFDVLDHLELRAQFATETQILTALRMLEVVEVSAPLDAVDRLRGRLQQLARCKGVCLLRNS